MSASNDKTFEDRYQVPHLEYELKRYQRRLSELAEIRDKIASQLKSQELKIGESKNVIGLYGLFRLKKMTQQKLQNIEQKKQHISNSVTMLENKIKMRMQSIQSIDKITDKTDEKQASEQQKWEETVFSEVSIDEHCNDLTHLSNKFVDTTNIDLKKFELSNNSNNNNNNDKTSQQQTKTIKNALNIANKRVFGDSYVKSENINVTKTYVNGEFEVMVPNGDIKTKLFKNEPVLSANVTFANEERTTSIQDEKTDNNSSLTMQTRVFYDSDGFRPIKNMLENKAGIIINTDKVVDKNGEGSLNSQLKETRRDYLKLFKRSSTRLTTNYIANMRKKDANMSKILFNRTRVIPEFIMRDYNIKQVSKAAQESCRAYFTGLMVGGKFVDYWVSKCYVVDQYSEYVGQGDYLDNRKAFPKAVASTFDGIAVDKNTRVIIYEKANFEGKILWDRKGPAIVSNLIHKDYYGEKLTDTWKDADLELQQNFPSHVREWSETNMHQWSYGSLRVISNISNDMQVVKK